MHHLELELPLLSICTTCRDGRETVRHSVRGGTRLGEAVLAQLAGDGGRAAFRVRGANGMSQCKWPCAIALSGPDRFTQVFGEPDPGTHGQVDALLALSSLRLEALEGILRRWERPAPLRAGILGRLPPPTTTSDLVTPLQEEAAR